MLMEHYITRSSQEAGGACSANVLVIDDNQNVTRALARILKQAGYATTVAHTGGEAMRAVERDIPSAAVVDIHLPDISGLVLSSKLRERLGPDRPIIVLSGDTSMETIGSLPFVGATYFISKPFKCEYLVERLRDLMGT